MEQNKFSQKEIDEINERLASFIEEPEYSFDGDDELPSDSTPASYDFLDDSFSDIDFSEFKGDFKKNVKTISYPGKWIDSIYATYYSEIFRWRAIAELRFSGK